MNHIIKLNLARNCIRYIIKAYGIKEIFIPYYTCNTVWQAIREENCNIKFYHIDKNFMPTRDFEQNSYILYTNYFGLCFENCQKLTEKYKNIIIDNAHGFYSPHLGLASFNSLRKFFKVQNGAFLYLNKKLTGEIPNDHLHLTPILMQENYEKFLKNELILNKEKDIKLLSKNVSKTMENINFETDKQIRLSRYQKYTMLFSKYNTIQLTANENNIPYCYPFNTTNSEILQKFIDNELILLRLWQNIPKSFIEHNILNNTIALPLNHTPTFDNIIKIFS